MKVTKRHLEPRCFQTASVSNGWYVGCWKDGTVLEILGFEYDEGLSTDLIGPNGLTRPLDCIDWVVVRLLLRLAMFNGDRALGGAAAAQD